MSKFDRIDHSSAEKLAYVEMMRKNLQVAVEDIGQSYDYIAENIMSHEITIKGHHIKYPFLYYFHHQPAIQTNFTEQGMPKSSIPLVKTTLIETTKDFISALIDSDRIVDYAQDILGSTTQEIFVYGSKFVQLYLSILTLPPETPVKLTANKDLDEICKSCTVGAHCVTEGDKFSKTFDAIFVQQLTEEVLGESQVISKERLMSNEEYITESKMTLGAFRKGLISLYPHKKHLYEDTSDED